MIALFNAISNYIHVIWLHVISYNIISYRIILYHIISYHIMSYYVISYYIMWYHIISYPVISYAQAKEKYKILYLISPVQFHLKNVYHILTTLLQKVTSIDLANGIIHVHGLDLLEGTPVLGERIEELRDVQNRGQSTTVLVSHTVKWSEERDWEREREN